MDNDRDDPGDIDRNGIPDSIQLDPVVVPEDPVPFSLLAPDPGLPGIDSPIEATADARAEPPPEPPVAPTPPSAGADAAAWAEFEDKMQRYNQMMQMYTNLLQMHHETQKAIIQNFRA